MSYGRKFKEVRRAHLLSQEEFAKKLGISRSVLSQIEIDKINPTIETIKKMAAVYDISLNYLMRDEKDVGDIMAAGNDVNLNKNRLREKIINTWLTPFPEDKDEAFLLKESKSKYNLSARPVSHKVVDTFRDIFNDIPFMPYAEMRGYVYQGYESYIRGKIKKIRLPIHQTGALMAFALQEELSDQPMTVVCRRIHRLSEVEASKHIVLVLRNTLVYGQVDTVTASSLKINGMECPVADIREIWLSILQIRSGNDREQILGKLNSIESMLRAMADKKEKGES